MRTMTISIIEHSDLVDDVFPSTCEGTETRSAWDSFLAALDEHPDITIGGANRTLLSRDKIVEVIESALPAWQSPAIIERLCHYCPIFTYIDIAN